MLLRHMSTYVAEAIGTMILVLLTLFGALPIYRQIARLSPHGEGSISLLEQLLPRWRSKVLVLILLPFAVPPVVSAVGLMQLFAADPLPLLGTPWILVGCYFTIALPFIYRAISNNMQAINLRDLMDAAHLLGASTWQAALWVVLPNLRKGGTIAVLLSFSFLIGEFVFANLLVGSRYETLQVYLYNMRNDSGHFTSALVISYFMFVLLMTWAANRLNKDKS